MKPNRRLALVPLVACLLVAAVASREVRGQDARPSAIHPWVWDRTADGGTADFFVVLREQADLSGAAELATKVEKGWFVHQALTSMAERTQEPLRKRLAEAGFDVQPFWIVNQILVTKGDRKLALEMAARPDVLRLDGNPVVPLSRPAPDPLAEPAGAGFEPQAVQWNIMRTTAPGVWSLGYRGEGIVVGGQDTGYRWTHRFIKGKYRGWNGSTANHDYNWHDSVHSGGAAGTCAGPNSPFPCDDDGHGTHTMGTVLGDDGPGNEYGMAPAAKWIGCRDMDRGNGTPATYTECFQWFLAPTKVDGTGADPSKAPDVTSNSWGCPSSEGCSWDTLQAAADAQKAAGIMTVAAAGNSGSSCSTITDAPAMYASVYTVGSTTSTDSMSYFSSRGPGSGNGRMKPDIVAPGSGVTSADNASDIATATLDGTSMATPNVAGGVALFWSARPAYTNLFDETAQILDCSARKLTAITGGCGGDYTNGPNNTWGYGLLDVLAAVNAAIPAPSGLTAAANADNRIDLSWTPGAGAVLFRVYRATSASGPWSRIAEVSAPEASFTDNGVSGGVTWHYQVRAVATCDSLPSNVASATATGPCTLGPSFGGLASVSAPPSASCRLDLAWSAATSSCGGPIVYSVYRSASSGFLPDDSANRVAVGLTTTTWSDIGAFGGTPWYYVVRAVDTIGGSHDGNLIRKSGFPVGPGSGSTNYDSTDVPKPIPDNSPAGVFSAVTIAGNGSTVTDVDVRLSITHSYDGDLALSLVAPNGVEVPLATNRGDFADDFTNTLFDDSASTPISAGTPPFTGSFRPETPLSAASGISFNGTWRLKVVDSSGIDTGSITAWRLTLATATACAPAVPRPVSDGSSAGTEPMTALERGDTEIDLAWDVDPCASPDYNLYRGAIGNWTAVTAGSCALGQSGIRNALPMPAESWWVVVGANPTSIGAFGRGGSRETAFTSWGTACPQATQDLSATCP